MAKDIFKLDHVLDYVRLTNRGLKQNALKALLSCLALLSAGVSTLALGMDAGRVITVIGKAILKTSDKDPGTQLSAGKVLQAGWTIKTEADGKAKLLLADKTVIDVNASTEFKVDQFKQVNNNTADREVTLSVKFGKIRSSVNTPVSSKGKFLIKTKSTTMGVRGTEIVIASALTGSGSQGVQNVNAQITVIHGKIEVQDLANPKSAPIELTTGKQLVSDVKVDSSSGGLLASTSTGSSGGPKVVDVPKQELESLRSESVVQNTTFAESTNIEEKSKTERKDKQEEQEKKETAKEEQPKSGSETAKSDNPDSKQESKQDGKGESRSDVAQAPAEVSGNGDKTAGSTDDSPRRGTAGGENSPLGPGSAPPSAMDGVFNVAFGGPPEGGAGNSGGGFTIPGLGASANDGGDGNFVPQVQSQGEVKPQTGTTAFAPPTAPSTQTNTGNVNVTISFTP